MNLEVNETAHPYRSLSVQRSPVPLTSAALADYLLGRRVYRRTRYMLLRNGQQNALVKLTHAGQELFEPVSDLRVLATGGEIAYITEPEVDTGIATQLAQVAQERAPEAAVAVVEGRHQHVNFIARPRPVPVRIVEVVPPHPPKLLEMARQSIDTDEELPPIDLQLETIDLGQLAADQPDGALLFPCRCAGLDLDREVHFLDRGPERASDWTLVGCERSREIHRALYGGDPARFTSMCPRDHRGGWQSATLIKCCLLERGMETEAGTAIVPWGANHREVQTALRSLVGLGAN